MRLKNPLNSGTKYPIELSRKRANRWTEISAEEICLNLIFDYPVQWSEFKVLRDFIQNFYDAVGHQDWNSRFSWETTDNQLILQAYDVGFSYEWLTHIGASTKRNTSQQYAGFFGEGFKMASLCAFRDFSWKIEMASRDWELEVIQMEKKVENSNLLSLGYKIWRDSHLEQPNSVLRIHNFPWNCREILHSALLSFFYKENPLLGKEIWASSDGAIFERSSTPKPRFFPSTYNVQGEGIVFAGFQAMGSLSYPLVFCRHRFRPKGRERDSFYKMDVVETISEIVGKIPPRAAAEILERFKNRWYEYPAKKYDFETMYHIISKLTKLVSSSPGQTQSWLRRHPHLLVALKVKSGDLRSRNRRHQALAWARANEVKFRLVQESFLVLGYPTLENVCEKNEGFCLVRDPLPEEIPLIEVLEEAVNLMLPNFFCLGPLPSCKVIKNLKAAWSGMAYCLPQEPPVHNLAGLKISFQLPYVALKERFFTIDWANAFSCYLHELGHVFGGDRSPSSVWQ